MGQGSPSQAAARLPPPAESSKAAATAEAPGSSGLPLRSAPWPCPDRTRESSQAPGMKLSVHTSRPLSTRSVGISPLRCRQPLSAWVIDSRCPSEQCHSRHTRGFETKNQHPAAAHAVEHILPGKKANTCGLCPGPAASGYTVNRHR